jgi:hypothetical protein
MNSKASNALAAFLTTIFLKSKYKRTLMANLRARSPKSAAEIVAEAPKWLNPLLTLLQELRETSMPSLKKTQKTRP